MSSRSQSTSRTYVRPEAARWASKWASRLPVDKARRVWRDINQYPTIADALHEMRGWSSRTAYNHFGARVRHPSRGGRPKKQHE